jgi:hypothetical protein
MRSAHRSYLAVGVHLGYRHRRTLFRRRRRLYLSQQGRGHFRARPKPEPLQGHEQLLSEAS